LLRSEASRRTANGGGAEKGRSFCRKERDFQSKGAQFLQKEAQFQSKGAQFQAEGTQLSCNSTQRHRGKEFFASVLELLVGFAFMFENFTAKKQGRPHSISFFFANFAIH